MPTGAISFQHPLVFCSLPFEPLSLCVRCPQLVKAVTGSSKDALTCCSSPCGPCLQLVKTVTGSSANPNDKLMIAVSSVAKTFVGDLVEAGEARLDRKARLDIGGCPVEQHDGCLRVLQERVRRVPSSSEMGGQWGSGFCREAVAESNAPRS